MKSKLSVRSHACTAVILLTVLVAQTISLLFLSTVPFTENCAIHSKPVEESGGSKLGHRMEMDVAKGQSAVVEGVAAVLLLHSPTWFQRRYSYTIENVVNNIPHSWKVQVFHTGTGQSLKGIETNGGIAKWVARAKVVLTTIPENIWKAKRKRYELMTERWLWQNMLAEKVLVFGGSSILCSNSLHRISDFLTFDYIGAPWGAFQGLGGEGGISLRSRQLMLDVIDYELGKALRRTEQQSLSDAERNKMYIEISKKWGQEDRFFVSRIQEMQKKGLIERYSIANKNASAAFAAVGGMYTTEVWAVSGTLPGLSFTERDQFISICPEAKIFFPSLHEPHCFGAEPSSEQCAATVCALRPKTKRKGGC